MESLKDTLFGLFKKTPAIDNLADVPAKRGKTGRFYCGRKVLNCKCCNGHCGPDNGCNCNDCKWLDIQQLPIEKLKFNRAGCRAIFNNGKHYCGRKVLTCLCCNGYCGPDFGCNCNDCKSLDELQEKQKPTIKENYEGFPATKGTTGKYYCGRKEMLKCSCCDGTCGPDNGCNCRACKWLDDQESGLCTVKITKDGALASKGSNGLYYCGRKAVLCNCCTRCEPNGHNCKVCRLLDEEEAAAKEAYLKKTVALKDFVGSILNKEVSIDIILAIAGVGNFFVHKVGMDDTEEIPKIEKGLHINVNESGVIVGFKITE